MKNRLLPMLALAGLSQLSFGELDIPRSIFRLEQLEEAKVKAAKSEKPLIFVFTDPAST